MLTRITIKLVFCGLIICPSIGIAQTAIGGSSPDPSAMLDVQSTNKGVLFPRMNTAGRGAITSPATGLMIFNTETGCLEINLGAGNANWQSMICTPGLVASLDCINSRQAGPHLMPGVAASGRSVRVPYTEGNGFDYAGQVLTSTGVTGLTATIAAGTFTTGNDSLTIAIDGTGASSGTADFALEIGGKSCTLRVPVGCGAYIAAGDWKEFSCYNLGAANTTADPFTPSWEIIGGYWQWGRLPQAAPGPTGTDGSIPNDGDPTSWTPPGTAWNTALAGGAQWLDASKTLRDPCLDGYRVPTLQQWEGVNDSSLNPRLNVGSDWTESATNYSVGKSYGPGLVLPAAGRRHNFSGVLLFRGSIGSYWSSSASGTQSASRLSFGSVSSSIGDMTRTNGLSVRCVKDN